MKYIRVFLSFIISTGLFVLLLFFSLNIIFKNVVKKQIIGGVAKEKIISEYIENNIDNEKEIDKIINNEEAKTIIDYVVNDYMAYLSNNNHKVSEKTVQNIVNYCVNNKETVNNLLSAPLTESEMKSQDTYDSIYNTINDGFKNMKSEIGNTPTEAIKIYAKLTSNNIQIVLIILIIICVILLMIINGSLYKWMTTFGSSLISVGILICGLYFILNYIVKQIMNRQNFEFNITIKLDQILIIGILEITIGIVLIIIKKIISKIMEKKEDLKQNYEQINEDNNKQLDNNDLH